MSPFPHYPCPMTAGAPLGETPRPHCLPHAPCPMPHAPLSTIHYPLTTIP
ncbi:MAG: hypothetical protein KME31_25605 [Tolypothrix carrinoi HA7290-LM1]|nr:hypothetical protein [Tolypothrix carrinoi HA7290-LM1]